MGTVAILFCRFTNFAWKKIAINNASRVEKIELILILENELMRFQKNFDNGTKGRLVSNRIAGIA